MKRSSLILLVASSLVCATAWAESRPHYGGTLRIAIREAPESLEPSAMAAAGASNLSRLVFETLVALDDRGRPQPLLAESWQTEPGNQRWRFWLRGGVSFHDGKPLDSGTVVASLRSANPEWKVLAAGNTVVIETGISDPNVPAELALANNAIMGRAGDQLFGTGPFAIAGSVPGKHLSLRANDEYWGGRPYLDSIETDFGKNDREQLTAMDLGKTDVVELAPENIRRARADGRDVVTSEPGDLLALAFSAEPGFDDEIHTRNSLAFSLDTGSISNVVLQGGAEPSGALLPNWLSGFAFVFPAPASAERARLERAQTKHSPPLTLGYDSSDPVARVIAERILLNARDVGSTLQLTSTSNADLRLVRLPLSSADPHVALMNLARSLQLAPPKFVGNSITDLYNAEKALLQSHRVIPLLHARIAVALRPNVRDFRVLPDGSWQLSNVWLAPEKP